MVAQLHTLSGVRMVIYENDLTPLNEYYRAFFEQLSTQVPHRIHKELEVNEDQPEHD
jgi:hypothetical protein